MYVRLTTFHTQPGTIDEAIRIVRDAVPSITRQ
jgi:hypothetical protein